MRLVLVEWVDSHIAVGGWKPLDDLSEQAPVVRSVGWLVRYTEEVLVLVPHMIAKQGAVIEQGCGEMIIPVRSKLSMVELSESGSNTIEAMPEGK